jgi:SAM-dependent methyltransferase
MLTVPSDVIVQLDNPSGMWILFNVFTYDTLAVETNTLEFISFITDGKTSKRINNIFAQDSFRVYDVSFFSNYRGLLADPTRRIRNRKNWPTAQILDCDALLNLLEKHHIIIEDQNQYEKLFQIKKSILDSKHLGNFHQQLGQYLFTEKRENPDEWWFRQKFAKDGVELKDTLYKEIQGVYLNSFFQRRFNSSHSVIDLGCGPGYYTNLIGKTGAKVLGVDPSKYYITEAKKNFSNTATFRVSEIGVLGKLDWVKSRSFDFVFMSDALLFYFVSYQPNKKNNIHVLFSDIKRILKPGGRFFSVEPSGVFWLRPWLGEENRPFTILTEYRNKRFRVAPNTGEIINSFLKNGFTIRDMKELYVQKYLSKTGSRASHFGSEFPLWWFFELSVE